MNEWMRGKLLNTDREKDREIKKKKKKYIIRV